MIVNLLIYFTDLKFAWNTMVYLLEKQQLFPTRLVKKVCIMTM